LNLFISISRKISIATILFLIPISPIPSQSIDDLDFYVDDYPPYNFSENGKVIGISVDLLLEIFKESRSESGIEDISLIPWARGYKYALEKENILLFAMTRNPERENLFHWVGPIASSNMVLIARKSENIRINSVDDIKNYNLGAVRKDIGELLLRRLLGHETHIYLTNNGQNSAMQLDLGRIELWSYEEHVAFWFIKNAGLNPDDFEIVYTIEEATEWFAVSKLTDYRIVEQMQSALDKVDQQTRNRIFRKYLH